jgi:hypothetical protein
MHTDRSARPVDDGDVLDIDGYRAHDSGVSGRR